MKRIFIDPFGGIRIGWLVTILMVAMMGVLLGIVTVIVSADRYFSEKSCEARTELYGNEEYQWYDFTILDYGCYNVSERGTTSDNYDRILIED